MSSEHGYRSLGDGPQIAGNVGHAIDAALGGASPLGRLNAQISLASRMSSQLIQVVLLSDVIDLAAVAITPIFSGSFAALLAGYYMLSTNLRWVIKTQGATTPPTWNCGNNAARTNISTSTNLSPSAAQITAAAALPWMSGSLAAGSGGTLIDMSTIPDVQVTIAATGGVLTGRALITAGLIPIADI